MATANVRFSLWLSEVERQAIRDKAREYNSSENYVIRMLIRTYLTTPTGEEIAKVMPHKSA
jgi:hypothetical protein